MLAAIVLSQLPASTSFTRNDPVNENYLIGYLTWKGDRGGIAWTQDYESTDPIGPAPSSTPPGSAAPPLDFKSDPIPRRGFINGTRVIHIDLYYQGGCPDVSVELRIGDMFVGGAAPAGSPSENQAPYDSRPAVSSPFCVIAYRVPSEVIELPAGGVLELKLNYHTKSYQFASKNDHPSAIKFPLYSAAEVAFRVSPDALGQGSPDGPGGTTSLLGLGFAPLLVVSRRRASLSILVAFLAMAMGGCLQPDAAPSATLTETQRGTAKTNTVPGDADENGSIRGTVHDENFVPIRDAHVSVLRTDRSAVSNIGGQFSFPNLPPQAYTLRVTHAQFFAFEGTFSVLAGNTTLVEIALQSRATKDSDFRPHRHDLWEGKPSKVIMDADIVSSLTGCLCGEAFAIPDDQIILPGTAWMEWTLTWDPIAADRVGIMFLSNYDADSKLYYGHNYSYTYPRASGETARIATGWEMTDVGHQSFTTWQFFLYASDVDSNLPIQTSFHVKLELFKGMVPFEPAHRDFWGTNDTFTVFKKEPLAVKNCILWNWDIERLCGYPSPNDVWLPREVVPPGTLWLEFVLTRSTESTPPVDWGIVAKPANVPPSQNENFAFYSAPTFVKREGTTKHYERAVDENEADAFYSSHSNWLFAVDDGTETQTTYHYDVTPVTLELTLIAHKLPKPT